MADFMSTLDHSKLERREFLQAGALASAAALTLGSPSLGDEPNASKSTLPTRKLGKTGVDVTILNHGTWQAPGALDRMLRTSYASGVRYFDTAKAYGTEPAVGKWLRAMPEVRKNIFLATKDWPKEASQMMGMLDERLAALKVDYVDLFFVHALGDEDSADNPIEFARSREFARAIEAIKKSGKAKFVGFSTHHPTKAEIIRSAAEGGFIDVIMLMHNPWIEKDSPLNKALDAAHAKGIGLVSMKQIAGQALKVTADRVPSLKARNLTPVQGLLHAIWSDERFSATCVTMKNLDQTRENVDAARRFEPLKQAEFDELRDAVLAAGPTLCPNCDGRCSAAAGTRASLCDLTRFYTYYEDHGIRSHARECYAGLSEAQRDWKGADLEAARRACHHKIDFARILPEVDRLLG